MSLLFRLLIALALLGMCLAASVLQTRTVSDADQTIILNTHNARRGGVSNPTASNMRKMYWSNALAAVAQTWVDQCIEGHDNDAERTAAANIGVNVGQNFAGNHGWAEAINSWYSEVKDFDYNVKNYYSSVYGHFSQVVWSESSLVGCAMKDCGSGYNNYICNYAYGNMGKQAIYNGGAPCADCQDKCFDGKLCDCPNGKICKNRGTLDLNTCICTCVAGYEGDECETYSCPAADPDHCGKDQPAGYPASFCTIYSNVPDECPHMCGKC